MQNYPNFVQSGDHFVQIGDHFVQTQKWQRKNTKLIIAQNDICFARKIYGFARLDTTFAQLYLGISILLLLFL